MKPEPFPWDRVIGIGLGVLRLSPDAFWRMTPREFALALAAVAGPVSPALSRDDFTQLMQLFPDADGAPRTTLGERSHG
jgi:uncharacterized phage protein (TIGR02216 family)